jgi:hypothetical protein
VAYIPDEAVVGRIKVMMQGDGEFNHTQTRSQMTTISGYGIEYKMPEFIGQFRQLVGCQQTQLGRLIDSR